MIRKYLFPLAPALALALGSISAQAEAPAPTAAASAPALGDEWGITDSDLPLDPAFVLKTLPNGMRVVIRQNATPAGQGEIRLYVNLGSTSETEDELGYAHFIEHMAFNGSNKVPEGEMIKLLEREGLAFGADTNASTDYDATVYQLHLPRNDTALLDTALMLMRETVSGLTFDQAAIDREKGVVLSEKRVRDTFAMQNYIDQVQFFYPEARFTTRLPIGTEETLNAATTEKLRALWQRAYTPKNASLVVVGDFDPEQVMQQVMAHFGDWASAGEKLEVDEGPVDLSRRGETDIHIDPALSERLTASISGAYFDTPDTIVSRQQNLLRQIGYSILGRRLQRIARGDDPPFRGAGLSTSDVFDIARTTSLVVDSGDGEWQAALAAAVAEYRRAMEYGFSETEVAEQVANIRAGIENRAKAADTLNNGTHVGAALSLLQDEFVPTTPESGLERFNVFAPTITPEMVLAALKEEALPLDNPLLRFEGRTAPEGGAEAIRAAWNAAMAAAIAAPDLQASIEFGYTDFGAAGEVVSDVVEPRLGIRQVRFANGLRLNLKPTDIKRDRVNYELNIDGGEMLDTKENPLATAMVSGMPIGGLGKHSYDELVSILAGRSVGLAMATDGDSFRMAGITTTGDLELQLQLVTALVSDPGFRPQGEQQYRRNIANFFARRDATAESALGNAMGGIVSDGDPRFTLQDEGAFLALSYAKLREDIGDRLANGAMEIGLVGDFDADAAIEMIARTLGALPAREADFRAYEEERQRSFTHDRSARIVRHGGKPEQALLRFTWPTRDDSDQKATIELEFLQRVVEIELTDTLREALGQTYSPSVRANQSRFYTGYGTFVLEAPIDVAQVDAARKAINETLVRLRSEPIDEDVLKRARQPMIESYENALKTNEGWMGLVDRAQSEPERIGRYLDAKPTLEALTGADVQRVAQRYLDPELVLEVLALPRESEAGGDE